MHSTRQFLTLLTVCIGFTANAQKIVYSEPEKDDSRRLNFEIAGKINGNFLIYKNNRNKSWIAVLDNDMKQIARTEQDYIPDNDRLINTDVFPYNDFCYLIYQYQKRSIVYCMASKIDGNGKLIGSPVELDTTHIGFAADNKIYTVLSNESKANIAVIKINSRNRTLYMMTTLLFNEKLELQKKSRLQIPMEDRNSYLSDFNLDNDGDLVFCKFFRHNNDNISSATFIIKQAQSDSLLTKELHIEKTWLDELHIKPDNVTKKYFLASFYYNEHRGNISGLYFYVWDKQTLQPVVDTAVAFSDELRKDARGDASVKMAFNDYFIRNIIIRKDGGFLIGSEAYYTTSRFNNWNRWDYLYGPSFRSSYNDYYYSSPYYNNFWWSSRMNNNQSVRYHADNIAVLSFSNKGEMEWNSIIGKNQYDDETDDLLSYQMVNTGSQVHFLFNQQEKRNNLLTDYVVDADGRLTRNPTLKNLDKGHEFMPAHGKQVSARQIIIPCLYRNSVCFAKVEYN